MMTAAGVQAGMMTMMTVAGAGMMTITVGARAGMMIGIPAGTMMTGIMTILVGITIMIGILTGKIFMKCGINECI